MCQECSHIMPSGARCHSPAMRGMAYCFNHAPERRYALGPTRAHKKPLKLPALVDPRAIQTAIGQVFDAMTTSKINSRTAGQLLFGLQIASDNFRRAGRPPHPEKDGATSPTPATDHRSAGLLRQRINSSGR